MNCINPPIRGSIVILRGEKHEEKLYQSPYKGFNRDNMDNYKKVSRINPPIRGSIEQDNALFENYNHKR